MLAYERMKDVVVFEGRKAILVKAKGITGTVLKKEGMKVDGRRNDAVLAFESLRIVCFRNTKLPK